MNDAAMRRAIGNVIDIAEREQRKPFIDPRHEEPPHGEVPWPHIPDPIKRARSELTSFVVRMVAISAFTAMVTFALWLALMVFAWSADMPRGPFLGGPDYYPPGQAEPHKSQWNNSKFKPWFDKLKSAKGLCCSFADGLTIKDVDWDTKNGSYRVRLGGHWIVVPDDAVVPDPNIYGSAVAWPYQDANGITQIRCFIPGSGA